MKSLIVLPFLSLAVMVGSSAAFADGFRCQTVENDLNVTVYNQTNAELGTRNAAVMVLSDPSVQDGRKTIAVFHSGNEVLSQSGATYSAEVDLRFSESDRKGENIAGTKLGYLQSIVVAIDFSYSTPIADGDLANGTITFTKRNGEQSAQNLTCTRYLKGQ